MLSYLGLEACSTVSLTSLVLSVGVALGVWMRTFSKRKPRSDPQSPSNRKLPTTIPRGAHVHNLLQVATQKRPSKVEKMEAAVTKLGERELPEETRSRGEARQSISWESSGLTRRLAKEQADNVDMDHVRLGIVDFLWTCLFVGPNTTLMHFIGLLQLKLRELQHWLGLVSPLPHDPAHLVYQLLMESFLTIHYQAMRKDEDGKRIAVFMWHDVPALDDKGEPWTVKLFTVEVDLDNKRMVQASLDEHTLTENEAIVVIVWIWEFVAHVRIHSVANWGVNTEQNLNPFLRRMGVVTTIYNFYGFRTFPVMCTLWHTLGLTSANYSKIAQTLDRAQDLIPAHGQIRELREDSVLVDFVIKVRNHFLNLFAQHQCEFPGIHGEALLVGTIFHSLDHTMLERPMEDPLWLDIDNVRPELCGMAELGRLILMCFNKDLLGLLFNKRYSDATPGSFFHKVYTNAASLNKDLADEMDCCICK